MKIDDLISSDNIADELSDEQLKKIGTSVYDGYESDLKSRSVWEKDLEKWTKLALQIVDEKTFPWKGASNVKYPLLSTAAMQFNARAYPSLVPADNKVVKCRTVGADPQATMAQEKLTKAQNLMQLMSLGTLDPMQVTAYLLEAFEIPNAESFVIQQPQQDPAAAAKQQEMEMKQQDQQMKAQLAQTQAQHKIEVENAKAQIQIASAEQKMALEAQMKQIDIEYKKLEAILKARAANESHRQGMQQQADKHTLNMVTSAQAAEQKAKAKPQQKGKETK